MRKKLNDYIKDDFNYVDFNFSEGMFWGMNLGKASDRISSEECDMFIENFNNEKFKVIRDLTHNTLLEIGWTITPIFILILVALPSMKLLYYMENPLRYTFFSYDCSVVVVGHQWYWSYEYINTQLLDVLKDYLFIDNLLEEGKNLNIEVSQKIFDSYMLSSEEVQNQEGLRLLDVDKPIIVPSNTRLRFFITSEDVIHSWAVPSLGIKTDAVPGRLSLASTVILESGIYYGQCSEICGVGHGFMPIKIIAI